MKHIWIRRIKKFRTYGGLQCCWWYECSRCGKSAAEDYKEPSEEDLEETCEGLL